MKNGNGSEQKVMTCNASHRYNGKKGRDRFGPARRQHAYRQRLKTLKIKKMGRLGVIARKLSAEFGLPVELARLEISMDLDGSYLMHFPEFGGKLKLSPEQWIELKAGRLFVSIAGFVP